MNNNEDKDSNTELVCGCLTISQLSKLVKIGDNSILFTPLEFDLMVYLAQNQNRPISPGELLVFVWKCQDDGSVDQVRSCIKRIRMKLRSIQGDENESVQYILTVRGWGYRLCNPEE